jgi:hypothetical protein
MILLVFLIQIDEWLKKNSYPRLSLPNICGYIPLTRHLMKRMLKGEAAAEPVEMLEMV